LKKINYILKNKKYCNSLIIRENTGYYYLGLCYKIETKNKKHIFNNCAVDRGSRTLLSFYSSEGIKGKLGNNIEKYYSKEKEKIKSITENNKKTQNMKRRLYKLNFKIQNKIFDIQNKLCKFLAMNFKTIIVGNLVLKNCVRKQNRHISKNIVKDLLSKHQGRLLQTLKHQCNKNNSNLIIYGEQFTTKTCSSCGNIQEMKGLKKYVCKKCKKCFDRDINSAKNILVKFLTLNK